ncbi:hypothetical protein DPMN_075340 [Dreissena polymorpha]|uniref:Uncharacterized protein n=1 Tax=Dreissena polymorpha TaxID=45954 RepID=A0A9D3YGV4_DREPO|nr:hypothetical protein DPMN_075340 [Dreissena polymorpha]
MAVGKGLRWSLSYNSETLRDQLYHAAEQRSSNQCFTSQQAQALQQECTTEMGVIHTEEDFEDIGTIDQLIISEHFV